MTHKKLYEKACIPCRGDTPPLDEKTIVTYLRELKPGWHVVDHHHIEKEFSFRDFTEALYFVNRVGELVEREGHHPDVHLSFGKVKIQLWTHKIHGLSDSDFIVAAKIDLL